MQSNATRTQFQIASGIKDTKAQGALASRTESFHEAFGKYSKEKQVAYIRIGLEEKTTQIRARTKIPFPESASLRFQEDGQLVKSQLTTKEITKGVRNASSLPSNEVGKKLKISIGLLAAWAQESNRGDDPCNRGRLHFILYILERCNSIHAKSGSEKLNELLILQKELLWARTYPPFQAGSTNDTHFTDQITLALKNIKQAAFIQDEQVSSEASLIMLAALEGQANITIDQLKKYLFAFPSHKKPPVIETFETYFTNNKELIGSAIMGGMHSVFHLDPPREVIFNALQTQLKSLNKYLELLGSEDFVGCMQDEQKGELLSETKDNDQVDIFLKKQDESTVYFPLSDEVCIYKKVESDEIYRFNLAVYEKEKIEWREKKLQNYEIDCRIEQQKAIEITRLMQEKKVEIVHTIPSGITAYTTSKARLMYWVQHKRKLKSAKAMQNTLTIYRVFKENAKFFGDAGFYLMVQKLLAQIISLDKAIWQNLSENVDESYESLIRYEESKIKSSHHASYDEIIQIKETIDTQVDLAEQSRRDLIEAHNELLSNLRKGNINAERDVNHLFDVVGSHLGSLATLSQLTMDEKNHQQKLIDSMKPAAVRRAKAIDHGYEQAAQEQDDELEQKKVQGSRSPMVKGKSSMDSLCSASHSDAESPALSPLSSPVLTKKRAASRTPSPASISSLSFSSLSSRDSTVAMDRLMQDSNFQELDCRQTQRRIVVKPPSSVFDNSRSKKRATLRWRQAQFNNIRDKLGYKHYAEDMDPVVSLVADYNLSLAKEPAEYKSPEDLFYSRLESKNKLAVALESNMIFNRWRWLPWNWWGWGKDIKTARLVLCHEMCDLFTWSIKEGNDFLDEQKIDAMYHKLNTYLENQKQYFSFIRGSEFDNELSAFQTKILTEKTQAHADYLKLKGIRNLLQHQEEGLTSQQKLKRANDHVQVLNHIPSSALEAQVTEELRIYALSVFNEQLQKIADKLKVQNPFGLKEKQLYSLAGELHMLRTQLILALGSELRDLENKFSFGLGLTVRVGELQTELQHKIQSNLAAATQDMNQAIVNNILSRVTKITSVYSNPSNPFTLNQSELQEQMFFNCLKGHLDFFSTNEDADAFEKMKKDILRVLQKHVGLLLSVQAGSVVQFISKELKLNIDWPVKKANLELAYYRKPRDHAITDDKKEVMSPSHQENDAKNDHIRQIQFIADHYIQTILGVTAADYKQKIEMVLKEKNVDEQCAILKAKLLKGLTLTTDVDHNVSALMKLRILAACKEEDIEAENKLNMQIEFLSNENHSTKDNNYYASLAAIVNLSSFEKRSQTILLAFIRYKVRANTKANEGLFSSLFVPAQPAYSLTKSSKDLIAKAAQTAEVVQNLPVKQVKQVRHLPGARF